MKKIILVMLFAVATQKSIGSTTLSNIHILEPEKPNQSSLTDWLEGRKFKNESTGLILRYGYISPLNTYGFTFTNSFYDKFYFINCSKELNSSETYGEFSNCLNPNDGSGIGVVKVYRNLQKIVVGDRSGQFTYYLIQN